MTETEGELWASPDTGMLPGNPGTGMFPDGGGPGTGAFPGAQAQARSQGVVCR